MADDLDDLDEAEGGPQPAEGRELVIVDLGHATMMPPSSLEHRAATLPASPATAPPADGQADAGGQVPDLGYQQPAGGIGYRCRCNRARPRRHRAAAVCRCWS
jgi:hypothetical protein